MNGEPSTELGTDTAADAPQGEARSAWERFLFAPQSTSAMTLIRIGWGAAAATWATTLLPDVNPWMTEGELRYPDNLAEGSWNILDVVEWKHAPLVACLLLIVTGITSMIGLKTRLSTAVAALCMLSLQRTSPLVFNSGDLLLRQVGIAVALAPCGLLLSVDAALARRRGGPAPSLLRAPWAQRFLQMNLALGYLLSAWAKARGTTWHDGTAVQRALRIVDVQRFEAPSWFIEQDDLLNLLTWGTLAFEACFLVLVWNRRAKPWLLLVGIGLHVGIDLMFDVGFFTHALLLSYIAFLSPQTSDRILAWIEARLPWRGRPRSTAPAAGEPAPT
ncbi:MAG: HTTM domain-containing protein [Actinomycetota bacterium]|nr:HTTM domain-containing protein [Actinomycetota bacterium]